jgi:hypothetical protein
MPRENQDLQDFQGNVPAAMATQSSKHANLSSKGPDRQSVLKRFEFFFRYHIIWFLFLSWTLSSSIKTMLKSLTCVMNDLVVTSAVGSDNGFSQICHETRYGPYQLLK